jgi:hypothetical protein
VLRFNLKFPFHRMIDAHRHVLSGAGEKAKQWPIGAIVRQWPIGTIVRQWPTGAIVRQCPSGKIEK